MKKVLLTGIAVLAMSVGCAKNSGNPASAQTSSSEAVAAVTIAYDYSAGNMGSYSVSDSTTHANLLSIWNDNDIRTYDGAIYVLERSGKDNLLKINGPVIAESTVVYEKNIGAAVNIQDIAFISSTKAYVTQYASPQVEIVDPSTGAKTGKTINLSAYDSYAKTDSADVVPYMSREVYANGKVYIACQRLKAPAGGYIQAADTSKIVVVNATTDSVEKAIDLIYKNPQELSICNGKLYVGSAGIWGVNDAGIEAIDLSTDTDIGSIVGESAFSGDIASIIVVSDTEGYAVISTPAFTTEVHSFNPETKTAGQTLAGIDAPCSGHLAFDGIYVYVGDRSNSTPGIVVIDPKTNEKVGTTKNVGLPPNSLARIQASN